MMTIIIIIIMIIIIIIVNNNNIIDDAWSVVSGLYTNMYTRLINRGNCWSYCI